MFNLQKRLGKIAAVGMTGVLVAVMAAGCGGAAEAEKTTIRFYDGGWDSQWTEIAIARFIIEKGYGYPTRSVEMTNEIFYAAVEKGEVDVQLEAWPQNTPDQYSRMIEEGYMEEVGDILEGGPQFFMVPRWVSEQYNIKTVFDLKDNWELFKDPEDPSKGLFLNSVIGWDCTAINELKLEGYGLSGRFNSISSATGPLVAAFSAAQKKKQPVVGYYWAPSALVGQYDWYILEEPDFDQAVWNTINKAKTDNSLRPLTQACAYPNQPLPNCVHTSLRGKAPDVVEMLGHMSIGLERINKVLAWAENNQVTNHEKTAVYFLREYDSLWKGWVTADAYAKVKAAVDNYGPVP